MVLQSNGTTTEVVYCIKHLVPTNKFIKFTKNSLGFNRPSHDLYITSGHPIMFHGVELPCQRFVNRRTIAHVSMNNKTHVYNLCCKSRLPIVMNGVSVLTWSQDEWESISNKKSLSWMKTDIAEDLII